MPIETIDPLSLDARIRAYRGDLSQQPVIEDQAPLEQPEELGFIDTVKTAFTTQNSVGSFMQQRFSRLAGGLSPFYGDPTDPARNFDPNPLMDERFFEDNPWAITGIDQLASAKTEFEFNLTNANLREAWNDYETLANSGITSNIAASLLVNVADPVNLIPFAKAVQTARGAKLSNTLKNVLRGGGIGAAANVVQEELLHAINPGRPMDRVEADLMAAGFGALFGGSLGFLVSPTFNKSSVRLERQGKKLKVVPTKHTDNLRSQIDEVFERPLESGETPRDFTDPLKESESLLNKLIDSPLIDHQTVSVLHRSADDINDIPADQNARKLQQLRERAAKEGKTIHVVRHPLQDDYDAFTPLEQALNDVKIELNKLAELDTKSKAAAPSDLAESGLDRVVQEPVTILGKALSFFTPDNTFSNSPLDIVQLTRRIMFYDGTVSKAAVDDPNFVGTPPAEALKDLYLRDLADTLRTLRTAYAPDRDIGLILGRNQEDGIELSGGKKAAALANREPSTWTDSQGVTHSIPAYANYNTFLNNVVQLLRERKAYHDGFIETQPTNISPNMETAAKAINDFYSRMLDLGDQAGILPGKRTLDEVTAKAEADRDALDELIAEQAIVEESNASLPFNKSKPKEDISDNHIWQMTRDEFESTGDELMHGTSRSFDRFDSQESKTRYNDKSTRDRYYFTEKDDVANTFANSTGFKQVDLLKWADDEYAYEDPALVKEFLDHLQSHIDAGYRVVYMGLDPNDPKTFNKLNEVKKATDIPEAEYTEGGDVRIYDKGRSPRVIKTKVYGKTLDLTDPKNVPADLINQLVREGKYNPKDTFPNFKHEFSDELISYARANGYGKIKVKDTFESGFESIIGLEEYIGLGRDVHREAVVKAVKSKLPVPSEVLKDYPDLAAQASKNETAKTQNEIPPTGRLDNIKFTNAPQETYGITLFDWGRKGLRTGFEFKFAGRRRKTFDPIWIDDAVRIYPGDNPTLVRELRALTGEFWEVKRRKGKYWNTDYYITSRRAYEMAQGRMNNKKLDTLEKKIRAAEERVAKSQQRMQDVQEFVDNADYYFTRKFMVQEIKAQEAEFTAWLKRSWQKARNFGTDPETGKRVTLAPGDRPILDQARARLKIPEEIRVEDDLAVRPDLAEVYEQTVDAIYDEIAGSVRDKIIGNVDNRHGIEHAFAGGSPLMKRSLTLDESDPAARMFLDSNPERILNSYFHTVGGKIATHTAIKRTRHLYGERGKDIETIDDVTKLVGDQFDQLHTLLGRVDRNAGTNMQLRIAKAREKVMNRLKRRIGDLEGRSLADNTEGANAMAEWFGRNLLSMNYLALLGSQVLSMMNDTAAMVLFTDITSVPKNIKYMLKAMTPLKQAPKRDLHLMLLAFEGEQSRIMSLADLDFDDPTTGFGLGRTRRVTTGISSAIGQVGSVFNEVTMANSWNRFAKRWAAYITMDRLIHNSRKLLKAQAHSKGGMEWKAAVRKAGLSQFDAARLKQHGIGFSQARGILEMIRKYGTDEEGNAFRDMSPEEIMDFKGIMLPDARQWVEAEGDQARILYETYLTAINTEVERAMIIKPSLTDRPLMNDHWWGRALNQFQTFSYAWGNKVAKPMAQRPAGRQLATITAYFGTGTMVDAVRNHISGRRDFDETAQLWIDEPLAMTYAVVNTSGLSGWFNRPLAMFDKAGLGPGAVLGNTVSRSSFQARSLWGSLSSTADYAERLWTGGTGVLNSGGTDVNALHTLRKAAPMSNLIWFRMMNRYLGVDPLVTENLRNKRRRRTIEP